MNNVIVLDDTNVTRLWCYKGPTHEDLCEDGEQLTFVGGDLNDISYHLKINGYSHYCYADNNGDSSYNPIIL